MAAPNARWQDFREILFLSGMAVLLGFAGGAVAWLLYHMIGLVTNLFFFQSLNANFANPFDSPLVNSPFRFLLILIPALGGLLIAIMIRYGSPKISGHGEPETIEAILTGGSRIQPRVGLLKPVSAAVTIGSGGPFGAEGPIIQTGGAVGSLLGQVLRVTTAERKILLASGAAAGMAAILGTPIAGILLVIELLLFEFRPRSFIPVAIASAIGGIMHYALIGAGPLVPVTAPVSFGTGLFGLVGLPFFVVLGVAAGLFATVLVRGLYGMEDLFQRLPIPRFYLPALGGLIVGGVAFVQPEILGTGYDLITGILNGSMATSGTLNGTVTWTLSFLAILFVAKAFTWIVALSSGSSGGTLAPLFMVGAAFGGFFGLLMNAVDPASGITISAFAIVGMSAVFAAASRATFASILFGAEVTGIYLTPSRLEVFIPIVIGCVVADAVAIYVMGEETVMTGKLARRGIRVKHEYEANLLDMVLVSEVMSRKPRSVLATTPASELRDLIADIEKPEYHMRSFPVVDGAGRVIAVITRNDLFRERDRLEARTVLDVGTKEPVTVLPDDSIYMALQKMVWRHVGHLPVVDEHGKLVGYLSRGDIHNAWKKKLSEEGIREGRLHIRRPVPPPPGKSADNGPGAFTTDNNAGGIIGKDPARREP